jgi:hypothetical protein
LPAARRAKGIGMGNGIPNGLIAPVGLTAAHGATERSLP